MSVISPLSEPNSKEEYLNKDKLVQTEKGNFNYIFEYMRGNEIIGNIDFSDLIISDKTITDFGRENITKDLFESASKIINQHVKLQKDDVEYCNGKEVRKLTEEDIKKINAMDMPNGKEKTKSIRNS